MRILRRPGASGGQQYQRGPLEASPRTIASCRDSIAFIIRTATSSSKEMILPAFLVLGRVGGGVLLNRLLTFQPYRRRLPVQDMLDKRYPYLDAGETNRLTLAVDGVQLEEISSAAIVLGPKLGDAFGGTSWTPESIELEINGRRVHSVAIPARTKLGPGGHLDLGWPGPAPNVQPVPGVLQPVPLVTLLGAIKKSATTAGGPRRSDRQIRRHTPANLQLGLSV